MKKTLSYPTFLLALLCVACSTTKPAATTTPAAASSAAQTRTSAGGGNRQEMLQELAAELKLTPEQQPQVTAILREQVGQLQAARDNAGGDRQQMMSELQRIGGATDAKMKAVLTAEQYGKYEVFKQERLRARRGGQ
ncbi:hypothetical protein [Hymenobacter canadensis]|uniref:Periplasmic heavy metal sensor n=1 Tax=Hymenobacter canadensis TaxID=2999067 RepID=A0ABY7LUQ1_9BACT|nr:hypothetical protein [Hymenobacter canadensis]WBA44120.1 hypothetical protein O3303_19720 [Hymenobacter canadensis]